MKSKRILIIHWAPDPDIPMGACGEECEVTYLDGNKRHYRHVYVTLSTSLVNCRKCFMAVSLRDLGRVKL